MATNPAVVEELNRRREKRVGKDKNPYGGSLRDYETFAKSGVGKDIASRTIQPTVLSDTSIRDKVIPKMNQEATDTLTSFQGESNIANQETQLREQRKREDEQKKQSDPFAEIMGEKEQPLDPVAQRQLDLIDKAMNSRNEATRILARRQKEIFDRQRSGAVEAGAVEQGALRGGMRRLGSRYTPGAMGTALAGAQRNTLEKLASIDEQELAAVDELRIAQENKDFQAMGEKLDILKGIRDERMQALEQTRAAEAQAARDEQVTNLISQGITDPVEMLQTLNEGGGNFTISEIANSLKELRELSSLGGSSSFKLDEKGVGKLIGGGWTVPEIESLQRDIASGASLNDIMAGVTDPALKTSIQEAFGFTPDAGDTSNLTPGAGATSSEEEFVIRQRLFPKMATILNKGTLSDSDREVINQSISSLRDMGMSEQQILDTFSGWSVDVTTPYNDVFRDIIISNAKDGMGTPTQLTQIGSLLSKGSYVPAMRSVENTAMDRARELEPDSYFGQQTTESLTKKIDRIKQLLQQGGAPGFVEGNFQKVLGRLKGADAARLRGELTALYNDFKVQSAGVSTTDSEMRFLEPLFADITDPEGNFMAKLDVFQRNILDKHNATRSVVNLPTVRVLDILEPGERLNLYAPNLTSEGVNSLGI